MVFSFLMFSWCNMKCFVITCLLQLIVADIVFPNDPKPCDNSRERCVISDFCQNAAYRMVKNAITICGWHGHWPLVCCPLRERMLNNKNNNNDNEECGRTILDSERLIRDERDAKKDVTTEKNSIQDTEVPPWLPNIGQAIGGIPSPVKSRPWMAAIHYRSSEREDFHLICGATLISHRFILTAAHCFDGRSKEPINYVIHLGDNHYTPSKRGVSITSIIPHENYQAPLLYNDIALVRLKDYLDYSDTVRAICLPDQAVMNFLRSSSVSLIAAGWGRMGFFENFSDVLHEVDLPLVSTAQCNSTYVSRFNVLQGHYPRGITDELLCAGHQNEVKDTCQGDSGGPLFMKSPVTTRWVIIGIISSGYRCGVPGVPGIYTKVEAFTKWIKKKLKYYS